MSPSSNWISAASRTGRKPVLCLAIESVDAISASIFDEAGWEAGTLVNLNAANTDVDPGVLVLKTNGLEQISGTFDTLQYAPVDPPGWIYQPINILWVTIVQVTLIPYVTRQVIVQDHIGPFGGTATGGDSPNNRTNGATFNLLFEGVIPGYTPECCIISGSVDGTTWIDLLTVVPPNGADYYGHSVQANYTIVTPTIGPWQFKMRLLELPGEFKITLSWYHTSYYTAYLPSGSTRTKSVDLGLIPTANSIVDISSDESSIATLTFEAFGSNDNAAWADLGTVSDGSSVPPYRYYQFSIAFTSTTGQETPVLRSIGVSGGDNQYKYYSTHPDIPVMGALPYLQAGIGTLSSSIQLMKIGTTGQASPKLFYLEDTFNLIQTGFLRNKTVKLLMGFEGLSLGDYEPIFTGLWYNGAIDLTKGVINVTTRTVFSLFQKVQLPAEKAQNGIRDAETCPPWFRIAAPIMQTMLDVLDLLGVPGRYIDSASFNALATSHFSGTNWLVSRMIDKDSKEDAVKLLEELSVLSGVFIVPRPDGVITAVLYDPTVTPTVELSPDVATFAPVELGQSELFTRQQILYNPKHKNDLTDGVSWGSWSNGFTYNIGDCAKDFAAGQAYHCYAEHVSSDTTQPGYGPGWRNHWYARWLPGIAYSATAPTSTRSPEKTVVSGGTIYTCILDVPSTLNMQPGVTSSWATYWSAAGSIAVPATDPWLWQTNAAYGKSDSIYQGSILYRCIQAHTSGTGTQPGTGGASRTFWATEWLSGVTYQPSDVVTRQGPLFTCITNHTSSALNEPTVGYNSSTRVSYQTYWYSDPVINSDSAQDFYNAYVLINNTAEINWGLNADVPEGSPDYQVNPGYQKNWPEKWNASDFARVQLATRMDTWFANPKMKLKVSGVPPSYYSVNQGTIVGVSGLMLPSVGSVWGAQCNMKPFLVMSKTFDPVKCVLSFDLLEV